jgi:exodeoxyribonuclease VII small subunit
MMMENPTNFEASLARLEAIVKNLEGGNQPLEDALASFQEGVGLVRQCQTLLSQAEQKVELLLKASASGVETRPIHDES